MKPLYFFYITAGLVSACASTSLPQTAVVGDAAYKYRADLQLTVNGAQIYGMGSYKITGPASIVITPPANVALDRVEVTTCARSDVFENVKAPYLYQYNPSPKELSGACPIYVEVFSKNALTAWGMIGVRSDEAMPAHVFFNGQGISFAGMSTGESKAGLEQTMTFQQAVKWTAEPGCNMDTSDNINFTFKPKLGWCRATFAAVVGGVTLWHRLLFLAYADTVIRQ